MEVFIHVNYIFTIKAPSQGRQLIKYMAIRGLLSILSFSILILLLDIPYGAYGRGLFGQSSSEIGICDSSVIKHGYKCQEIHVTTKDGYVLNMQRIPEGRVASVGTKKPVLLQHGLLVDGVTWLLNQPEQNLPMILADNGFDVWISNTRGTRFSRRHTSLNPNAKEFWEWSWDEMAANDLPAFVDFIYNQTGQKVNYVGHSQGTLMALASFSERSLVLNKLKSATLLSPIAYMGHVKSTFISAAANVFLGEFGAFIGLAEFNPKGEAAKVFLKSVCSTPGVNCYDFVTSVTGKNCCLNSSTANIFLDNEAQSTSIKNLIHFSQLIRDKVMAKFNGTYDYNLKHYGATKPPVYNISNIPHDFPLFLSYGGNDALSVAEDVEFLHSVLKSTHDADKLKVQLVKDYGHVDFIMAVNAKDVVYNQVVEFFKSQN